MDLKESRKTIEDCDGCKRIVAQDDQSYCGVYNSPLNRWSLGICPMATHKKVEIKEDKRKLNPLKASKRGG